MQHSIIEMREIGEKGQQKDTVKSKEQKQVFFFFLFYFFIFAMIRTEWKEDKENRITEKIK